MNPALRNRLCAGLLAAAALVGAWEGRRLVAYPDILGVWTICDGITRGVRPGQTATPEECDRRLFDELVQIDRELMRCGVRRDLPGPYAAAVSLAYNVGSPPVCRSTFVLKLNAGDIAGACNELRRWVYAGGKRVQGLANRREAEREVCLS